MDFNGSICLKLEFGLKLEKNIEVILSYLLLVLL